MVLNYPTETLNFDLPSLPEKLEVPKGAVHCGQTILSRFYEPNNSIDVPRREINSESKFGQYRDAKFCYGFEVNNFDGVMIHGQYKELDHTLGLMANAGVSRVLGRELVKLLVAKKFADDYRKSAESEDNKKVLAMVDSIDEAVKKLWSATMQ